MTVSPPQLHDFDVPPWADLKVDRPADAKVLTVAAAVAVAVDLALRSGLSGLAGALLVVAVSAGLLASGRVVNPDGRALAAAAPVFGCWLALRSSPPLLALDLLATGVLLALAGSYARAGSVADLSVPAVLARGFHGSLHLFGGPGFAAGPLLAAERGGIRAALRGLVLAAPIVAVLAALLASGDAVFASVFRSFASPASLLEHAVLLGLGGWAMAGLLRLTSTPPLRRLRPSQVTVGPVEATVVLASLVVLFAGFVVAQLIAASEGGRRVLETAGLTYAEYARSGFFQLLAVAGITLTVLLAVRAATGGAGADDRTRLLLLSEATVVLTLLVVIVALRRLDLYEDAYGLTLLRFYSKVFAVWMAIAFVLLGVALAGVGGRRHWLVPAAGLAGLTLLLVVNVLNPEAFIVRRNIAHAERTGRFDAVYASALSDDAVPGLVTALARLSPPARDEVVARLGCDRAEPWKGWAAWNLSGSRADRARSQVCPPGG